MLSLDNWKRYDKLLAIFLQLINVSSLGDSIVLFPLLNIIECYLDNQLIDYHNKSKLKNSSSEIQQEMIIIPCNDQTLSIHPFLMMPALLMFLIFNVNTIPFYSSSFDTARYFSCKSINLCSNYATSTVLNHY